MTLWDPVRLRATAPEPWWSDGRTTMRRFSAQLSPQAGVFCWRMPAGVHWTRGSSYPLPASSK